MTVNDRRFPMREASADSAPAKSTARDELTRGRTDTGTPER